MTIKAIIFDMDDTLVVEEASAEAAFVAACLLVQEEYGIAPENFNRTVRQKARDLWYASPARQYCVDIGISSWEGLWARFEGDDPNLQILREWAPTYRHQSWSNALVEFGIGDDALADGLSSKFQAERRMRHVVYSDVEPVLEELQESYRLALVSNGAPDLQREKLEGSKLVPYFDVIIVSGEVGIGKPDSRIFATVLERLGVSAEKAVMVGNSLKSDIAGAQQAGIKAIWLNRDKKDNDNSVKPDYEITNLSKLQVALHNLE